MRTNELDSGVRREDKKQQLVSADEPAGQTIRTRPSRTYTAAPTGGAMLAVIEQRESN